MTDRIPDFFDPESFADLSDGDVVTSSVFDASEPVRAEDLRTAELDEFELEPGSSTDADALLTMRSRAGARRRHALTALGAGLAVVMALFVHSVATTPVVPSPRRPFVFTHHSPDVSPPPARPLPSRSGFAAAHRSRRPERAPGRRRLAAGAVDRAQPTWVAPRVAGTAGASAPADEFGFER
jgi:hypothetical protein